MTYPTWYVYVRGWYKGVITRGTRRRWSWSRNNGSVEWYEPRCTRTAVIANIARSCLSHPGDVAITKTRR